MGSRIIGPLLAAACAAALCGCCCGTTTYTRSVYQGDYSDHQTDGGRIYVVMGGTRTIENAGGLDTADVIEPPYSLEAGFYPAGEHTDPVRILSAQLVHQGRTVVLHDRASPPLEEPLVFDEAGGRQEARVEFPLGVSLPFVEGSTAEATLVVEVPWEEDQITLEKVFVGEFSEESGTIWDAWMGV